MLDVATVCIVLFITILIKEVITTEDLYRVRLQDAFAPSFCLFDKSYYGTRQAILAVLERLGCSAELDGANEPEPVQVLGSRQVNLVELNDTFKNLWGLRLLSQSP